MFGILEARFSLGCSARHCPAKPEKPSADAAADEKRIRIR